MKGVAFGWRGWLSAGSGMRPAAAERLRLFREGRLAVAAAGLAAFPALAVAEPWPAAAGLMLAGVLPAAVALDCRRPGHIKRATGMALVAAAAALAAAVLKGLPAAFALAMLAVQALEAAVADGRIRRIAPIALLGFAAIATAAIMTIADPLEGTGAAAALMLAINVAVLARGLLNSLAREREAARTLRGEARDFEAMASEAVVAADRSGAVLRASANAERLLGLPAASLRGRGLAELVLVADRPLLLTALCDCALGGPTRRLRLRLRSSVGPAAPRYRRVELTVAPGEPGVALAALRDVTDRVAAEEAQAALAAEIESAGRARAAFLATVNHELRTPLNAIIGFSDILANPATTPQSPVRLREYATLINGAGQDLLRIVTAMIDITRLDSGVYEFEAERADLGAAVAAAAEAFRHEPEAAELVVEVLPTAESIEAGIDERAFRGVLHQLLSNAAKFGGAAGKVTIATTVEGEWAHVAVRDRGPGVPPEKLRQLGRHFARADEGLARERGGVGLGLSLAAGLMALHGGRIGIDNAPDGGAVATLTLPRLARGAEPAANVHPLPETARRAAAPMDEPVPARRRA